MPPFIFLIGVVKVHIAGEPFAKAESSRSLSLVLCPVEFGLDDEILWAPGICEVDKFQIHRLKAVFSTCVTVKAKNCQEKLDVKVLAICLNTIHLLLVQKFANSFSSYSEYTLKVVEVTDRFYKIK